MNKKGKAICISSAKGGVGKTTTTINLAGIFSILNKKVLIIDFDLTGGCIAAALNLETPKNIYSFASDVANNTYKDLHNYTVKYNEYIDILATPKDPRQGSKIDAKYVEMILNESVYNYDIVLIDTSHNLNDFKILTMDMVDKLLLILTNDPLDLKNTRSLVALLNDVNYDNYKIILNESVAPFKKYFSLYDIKNIIKSNIDYVITKDFYIKNIDSFVMEGKIIILDPKAPNYFSKDYTTYMQIATDIYNKEVEERVNEE